MVCKLGFDNKESSGGSITGKTTDLYTKIHGWEGLVKEIEDDSPNWTGRFRGPSISVETSLSNQSIIKGIHCKGYSEAQRASDDIGYLNHSCGGCRYNKTK